MSIPTNRADGAQSKVAVDRTLGTGTGAAGSSGEFDAHKHTMRSFEKAAQDKAYDQDDVARIFQEATDGDGEEAEALAKNGLFRGAKGAGGQNQRAEQAQQPKARAPQQIDAPQEDHKEDGGARTADNARVDGRTGTAAAAERVSETQSLASPSLNERQGHLVARLVTQPADYRGLSAAFTEAAIEPADSVQGIVGKGLWVRTPNTTEGSMADQVSNARKTKREEELDG